MIHRKTSNQSITGIILSGGYSTRFQKDNEPWLDKALMSFKGEIILQKTIKMLSNLCEMIIVMVKFEDQKSTYQTYIDQLPKSIKSKVLIAKDNKQLVCNGPTLGIISSLDLIESEIALVVPIDLPLLNEKIMVDLLKHIDNSSLIAPFWPDSGKIEPLVFIFNVKAFRVIVPILSQIKRSRADDFHRIIKDVKFLPINIKRVKEIDVIFTSLNERSDFEKTNNEKKQEINDYFTNADSRIITNKENSELLTRTKSLLKKYNFMELEKKPLDLIISQTQELIQQEMFFLAGVLSFHFASKIIIKEPKFEENLQKELIELCIKSFKLEAFHWKDNGIHFLELHSLSDALVIAKKFNLPIKQELEEEIVALKELLGLKKKKHDEFSLHTLLENKVPIFLDQAMKVIQESEKSFNEESPTFSSDFLWDHSLRVGKIAYKLALREGIDPLIPTIAAILHDAGKFVLGKYHSDDVTEEEHSSTIAQKLLENSGLSKNNIEAIKTAIYALYNETHECNINCEIIHDADRLEKLGPLGIANFFTKMTLRGVNLSSSILKNLSRELTYTIAAPKTMLTETGKQLAESRSKKAVQYFEELLEEFAYYDLGKFYVREFELEKNQNVTLVIPETCQQCKGEYSIKLSKESGIKCEKVIAKYSCNNCKQTYKTEFCLPLVSKK